jgi:hypothetical protein
MVHQGGAAARQRLAVVRVVGRGRDGRVGDELGALLQHRGDGQEALHCRYRPLGVVAGPSGVRLGDALPALLDDGEESGQRA